MAKLHIYCHFMWLLEPTGNSKKKEEKAHLIFFLMNSHAITVRPAGALLSAVFRMLAATNRRFTTQGQDFPLGEEKLV